MNNKHDIFISHESNSLPYVETLAEMFEKNGVNCWYAPRNLDDSGAGKEYDDEIVEAIQAASAVVVILNDEALKSTWVKREIAQAEKQGKMIFPFVISQLTINNGLLMRLEVEHLINAYPTPEEKEPLLLKNVKLLLGQDVSKIKVNDHTIGSALNLKKNTSLVDLGYEEGLVFLEASEDQSAFLAFLRSAEAGNIEAQNHLIKILFEHCREPEFLDDETWSRIEELSDAGEAYADLLMHYRYYGMGTQEEIALKYLARAMAKQVSPFVYLQMGICHRWGLGGSAKPYLSLHYYKKAYNEGCIEAASFIGQAYLWGGEKISKDLQKAESILKEGIEKGDRRSWTMLISLYNEQQQYEKMYETIQNMIQQGIKGAYCEMGDYYLYQQDSKKAEEYYMQAVNHNEKNAWGMLSFIYWNNNDSEEAFRMAKKGEEEKDGFAYYMLGCIYKEREDYAMAWKYYMQRNNMFGVGAEELAGLYLEHGYIPEDYTVEQLKKILDISVKLQNTKSIVSLIKIILKENNKPEVLDYESIHDTPEVYGYLNEAIHLQEVGPEIGQLRFIYAQILLDKNSSIYNPFRAMEILEKEVDDGNENATHLLLLQYKDRGYDEKQKQLISSIISHKVYLVKDIDTILKYGPDAASSSELTAWIVGTIDKLHSLDKEGTDITLICKLYKVLWNTYFKDNIEIPDEQVIKLQQILEQYREEVSMTGCLSLLREHAYLIHPNYDPEDVLKGDFYDEKNFQLLFDYTNTNLIETEIRTSKVLEERFYAIITSQIQDSAPSFVYTDFKEFYKAYLNVVEAFDVIRRTQGALPIAEDIHIAKKSFNPICTIKDAVYYTQLALKMLISTQKAYGDDWPNIADNLGDNNALLDIAEKLTNENAQFLIISVVETYLELSNVCTENINIRNAIFEKDKKAIAEKYNEWRDFLMNENIPNTLPKYEEDTLPENLFDNNTK